MKITIFLMCYNEELLLPYTLKHYQDRFPSAKFVLVDNYSKDSSCEIAKENGVEIRQFDSGDKQCEEYMLYIRNTIWNDVKEGWVLMCDMDEWLEMTESQLMEEEERGSTIITTNGFSIIGNSKMSDLSDFDLFKYDKGIWDTNYSKRVLFKVPNVKINYWWGCHKCFPEGNIKYSDIGYTLKHMNYLGVEYLVEKHSRRYFRNEVMRSKGMNGHYTLEIDKIKVIFDKWLPQIVQMSIPPNENSWAYVT
jgi:glycosyltransferase involved in cell wall biosynthesis